MNRNKIELAGRLTRDPEVSYTPRGTCKAELGLAINERRYNPNHTSEADKYEEHTVFLNVDVWGRSAEACQKYLAKGDPIFIDGKIRIDEWDDAQTGKKRRATRLVADHVEFLRSRPARDAAPRPHEPQERHEPKPEPQDGFDDIPF